MVHAFTWNRKTKRWLVAMFFNMVDLASIASSAVFRAKFPVEQLSHEDNRQRFNMEASQALSPCINHATCTNPDPARTGEAEHLYRYENAAACRDLSTKEDKERWHRPKEAEEMPFLSCETWLQNQIDLQQVSPSYLPRKLMTLLPSLLWKQPSFNNWNYAENLYTHECK